MNEHTVCTPRATPHDLARPGGLILVLDGGPSLCASSGVATLSTACRLGTDLRATLIPDKYPGPGYLVAVLPQTGVSFQATVGGKFPQRRLPLRRTVSRWGGVRTGAGEESGLGNAGSGGGV